MDGSGGGLINHGGGRHGGVAMRHFGRQQPAAASAVSRLSGPSLVLLWLSGSILFVVVALAAVAAVVPVPLDLVQGSIEGRVDRHIEPLRISAEHVEGRLLPSGPSLALSAEQLSLASPVDARVAFLPAGSVVLPLGPLLRGTIAVSEMTLDRPSFEVSRGELGAIGISLGTFDRALDDDAVLPLTSIAAIGKPIDCCRGLVIPRLRIADGKLTFRDQASGARLLFDQIALDYDADAADVPLRLAGAQIVGDQGLRFEADIQRPAGDGTVAIHIRPDAVYPAVLGEAVPGSAFFKPFEVPVSGEVLLALDPDQALARIAFDLEAGSGSLEVAEFNADNIAIKSMTLRGEFDRRVNVLRVERSVVRLAGGRVVFAGSARKIGDDIAIALTANLVGLDLATLLPGWFAGLRAALNAEPATPTGESRTRLWLEGVVRPESGTITARGTVDVADEGATGVPPWFLAFDLGGDLRAPRLVVHTPGG